METVTMNLPKPLYDVVVEQATMQRQTPEGFIQAFLMEHLAPAHPYVEIVPSRSGLRAVVKGARVGVDVIVGYSQAGYTPAEIADDILPHLTLAQVYDALSYYEDHRPLIDQTLQTNTPQVWRERLQQQLGAPAADKLLGA